MALLTGFTVIVTNTNTEDKQPKCTLCNLEEPETAEHYLFHCPYKLKKRQKLLTHLSAEESDLPENFPPNIFLTILKGNIPYLNSPQKKIIYRDLGIVRNTTLDYIHNITNLSKPKIRDILIERARINIKYLSIITKRIQKHFNPKQNRQLTPTKNTQETKEENERNIQKTHSEIQKIIKQINKHKN